MKYTIHGPFEIRTKRLKANKVVTRSKSAQKEFWNEVRKQDGNKLLPSACGCYLFAVRASKGIRPWYVGLAKRLTFEKECFTAHKINIYNEVLADQRRGVPVLFLIAKRTPKGKFAKRSSGKNGHADSAYLEDILIDVALDKNAKLMNVQKTKFLKNMCVPGLINTRRGKLTKSEKEFKRAIEKGTN